MPLPDTCLAAVFDGPHAPMQLQRFTLPRQLPPGGVLCRVLLSTICGSDLHTTLGRRVEPAPSILGHESVGEVVAADAAAHYWDGSKLSVGDRVSWSIMSACGSCALCRRGLPQKCVALRKYGHSATDVWPSLTGGYAEFIYLFPGTGIFPVPDILPDEVAAPANCALATVLCALEAIGGVTPGEAVLILGAGLLGTYLTALCAEAGASVVLVADQAPTRAEAARNFGATDVLGGRCDPSNLALWARDRTGGAGVDLAFEVCGAPEVISAGIEALRTGGRFAIAGLVTPKSEFALDGNVLTRKLLTLRGVHNYHPRHLGEGLAFLARTSQKYPYRDLVSPQLPLAEINRAFDLAQCNAAPRVGLRCAPVVV